MVTSFMMHHAKGDPLLSVVAGVANEFVVAGILFDLEMAGEREALVDILPALKGEDPRALG